jgi:hypothetical protein
VSDIDLSKSTVLKRDPRKKWEEAFNAIPVGKARPLSDIAKSLGASANAARIAAQRYGCNAFIEVNGSFVACAVNPKAGVGK